MFKKVIRLSDRQKTFVNDISKKLEISETEFIRRILDNYIRKYEFKVKKEKVKDVNVYPED